MDTRTFAISTASSLSLALTTGCADPIIGAWDLTSAQYDGDTVEYPLTSEGDGYSVTIAGSLSISEDLTGEFVISYDAVFNGEPETQSYTNEVTVVNTGKGAYDMTMISEGEEMSLSCTLDETLTCTSTEEGEIITFTPAE
jgi:hypothetical protein